MASNCAKPKTAGSNYPIETPITEILSEYIAKLEYAAIPESAVAYTRLLMLDYFAASYAGRLINRVFNDAVTGVVLGEGGAEQSSVFFADKKIPALQAAFVNACYAHGADIDDGNRKAMGHIGAPVISAVLALAETLPVSEQDVITAIVVGYDVFCRLSAAVQPGLVYRGFHSTGTTGAVAAAAACAKLLKLDVKGIYNAIALSVTQASGLLLVTQSGQMVKPLNPARAAQTGVLSALLVKGGVEGGRNPLESERGWCHAMSEEVDLSYILDGLGKTFAVSECYIKPYPACRHTHGPIEAAILLHRKLGQDVHKIQKIDMYLYEAAMKVASVVVPATDDETKFSCFYTVACGLLNGSFGFSDLKLEGLSEELWQLVSKIKYIPDNSLENREKGIRGVRLVVTLENGSVAEETVLVPKGEPETPLSMEDVFEKLCGCAVGMDNGKLRELYQRVSTFGRAQPFQAFHLT